MGEWAELKVSRTEVEIATVLACGQSFRWKLHGPPEASEWIGVFAHKVWLLKQNSDTISYKVLSPETSVIPADNGVLLYNYFQLGISLPSLYEEWSAKDEKFASLTTKDYQGIRMLAQDPIENIFSFICSSNNNIQRISQMVEKLCLNYGTRLAEIDGKAFYDFPKVETLVGDAVEKRLREESFGYRAGFIAKTAEKIVENGGIEWVEGLKSLKYGEARVQLQTLPGIGRKVADCICLMSLGYPQAIPVDTHIHQVAKQYLPHLASVKTLTDKVYSEITDYFLSIYGDYAGWAHSVLFASTLRHLKSKDSSNKTSGAGRKAGGKSKVKKDGEDDSLNLIGKEIKAKETNKTSASGGVKRKPESLENGDGESKRKNSKLNKNSKLTVEETGLNRRSKRLAR